MAVSFLLANVSSFVVVELYFPLLLNRSTANYGSNMIQYNILITITSLMHSLPKEPVIFLPSFFPWENLPVDVQCHILSMLHPQHTMLTARLVSRKWQNLVSRINFDFSFYELAPPLMLEWLIGTFPKLTSLELLEISNKHLLILSKLTGLVALEVESCSLETVMELAPHLSLLTRLCIGEVVNNVERNETKNLVHTSHATTVNFNSSRFPNLRELDIDTEHSIAISSCMRSQLQLLHSYCGWEGSYFNDPFSGGAADAMQTQSVAVTFLGIESERAMQVLPYANHLQHISMDEFQPGLFEALMVSARNLRVIDFARVTLHKHTLHSIDILAELLSQTHNLEAISLPHVCDSAYRFNIRAMEPNDV